MKANGIYSALTLSFFLHAIVITISFYIAREFYTRKPMMPYSVSLVFPTENAGSEEVASKTAPEAAEQEAERKIEKQSEKRPVEQHTETRHKHKINTSNVKDRIEELAAIHRLEKLAALRKIVDIGARQRATQSKYAAASGSKTSGGDAGSGGDYYALVESKIRQQWVFPETIRTDLETVVSIKIASDGRVTIESVEKGSGNSLFDRSVLRAINMASPLPPPLKEMEIGLRFRP